jgi:hypothetical protein
MVKNIGQNSILNLAGEKIYVFSLPRNKLMYIKEKDANMWLLPNRYKKYLKLGNKVLLFEPANNRTTINSNLRWLLKPKPPVRRYPFRK